MIMILVTYPMPIRVGVLAIRNRGASFSNFPLSIQAISRRGYPNRHLLI